MAQLQHSQSPHIDTGAALAPHSACALTNSCSSLFNSQLPLFYTAKLAEVDADADADADAVQLSIANWAHVGEELKGQVLDIVSGAETRNRVETGQSLHTESNARPRRPM